MKADDNDNIYERIWGFTEFLETLKIVNLSGRRDFIIFEDGLESYWEKALGVVK